MDILAIDPGDTMGCAHIYVPPAMPAEAIECWEEPFVGVQSVQKVWDKLVAKPDIIVIEDWRDKYGYAEARNTCRVIGMFEMLATQQGVPVRLQPAAFRFNISDDKKVLEPLGYWYRDLKPHDDRRQALRHGLAYVSMKLMHRPTLEHIHPRPTA